MTETRLKFHDKNKSNCLPPNPTPPDVRLPLIVNVVDGDDGFGAVVAVRDPAAGFESEPCLKAAVIVPGPVNVTLTGSFDPEHDNPPLQLQPESVYPDGT